MSEDFENDEIKDLKVEHDISALKIGVDAGNRIGWIKIEDVVESEDECNE